MLTVDDWVYLKCREKHLNISSLVNSLLIKELVEIDKKSKR